jgi:phage replication initiation protein
MNSKSNITKTHEVTGFSKENPVGNPSNSNRVTGAKTNTLIDTNNGAINDIIFKDIIEPKIDKYSDDYFDIIDDTLLEEALTYSDTIDDITEDNTYKIDWLSFTFPVDYLDEVFNKIMIGQFKYSLDDFKKGSPKNFYNTTYTIGNYVNIMYNSDINGDIMKGNKSATANIVFTGQGMSDIRNRVGSFMAVLRTVWAIPKVNIARIDIAFDSFHKKSEVPHLSLISKKLDLKEYKSPKRSHNIIKEEDSEGNIYGHTCYIGSSRTKSSEGSYYGRVYSKYHQYLHHKNAQLPELVQKTKHWERWELVFTKKKAHHIVNSLLNEPRYQNDINMIFKEMLGVLITFLEPTTTRDGVLQRKTRWNTCTWWTDFLNSDKKYQFTKEDHDADFTAMLHWIANAVAPTINVLTRILEVYGYDFMEILKEYPYKQDLSKKHIRAMNDVKRISQDKVNHLVKAFATGEMHNKPREYYKEANNEDIQEK